ncbi:MAG: prolipoprotein diacylglyceryl transferase family protein, partial [Microcystis panniformis]
MAPTTNQIAKSAIKSGSIADLAIWLVVGAIPAARLYYVLFQWQEYAQNPAD